MTGASRRLWAPRWRPIVTNKYGKKKCPKKDKIRHTTPNQRKTKCQIFKDFSLLRHLAALPSQLQSYADMPCHSASANPRIGTPKGVEPLKLPREEPRVRPQCFVLTTQQLSSSLNHFFPKRKIYIIKQTKYVHLDIIS